MSPNELKVGATGEDRLHRLSIDLWQHKHVLDLDDFSREEIDLVFEIADGMAEILARDVKKVPTLRGKTIATMFFEPSTRTRASFELAAKYLGADTVSLDAARSSVTKGESLVDSLRTLQALQVDTVIMRHPCSGAPYVAAQNLDVSIINGGDGCHAHPSQSLLDLYTLRKRLGNLQGLRMAIVGDILHSRVARSHIWGSRALGINVTLCAPPTLMPHGMRRMLEVAGHSHVALTDSLDLALKDADVVMPLRLQKERQQSGLVSIHEYIEQYQVNSDRLEKARPGALVMHPGPMNEGLEISHEIAHGTRSLVEQQVTNGVAVRMALLYLVSGGRGR